MDLKIRIGTARFYFKNLTGNHIPGSICVKLELKPEPEYIFKKITRKKKQQLTVGSSLG
jgi:hypothetical protein